MSYFQQFFDILIADVDMEVTQYIAASTIGKVPFNPDMRLADAVDYSEYALIVGGMREW